MPTPQELEARFWEALKSDMTMMLGIDDANGAHPQPMTAQIEGARNPIWFFSSKETGLVRSLRDGSRATATFTSKGHDLFVALQGRLSVDNDPAIIDRLWNPYVAAWFKGGKDDPKLVLLRFDGEEAQIWEDASSLVEGIKMMFGADPKETYKEKVARVSF
jgi:general stress protein 26